MVKQSYPRWANRIARSGRKAVVLRRRRADIASARPDSILRIAAPPEHFTGAHASRTLRTKLLRLFKPIRALVVREGPRGRIHLPPALSPLRTLFSGGKRGKVRGDDKGRSRR